jgi:hypothetical protein
MMRLMSRIKCRRISLPRLASCTVRPSKLLYENAPHLTHGAVVPVVWTGSGKNKLRPVAG